MAKVATSVHVMIPRAVAACHLAWILALLVSSAAAHAFALPLAAPALASPWGPCVKTSAHGGPASVDSATNASVALVAQVDERAVAPTDVRVAAVAQTARAVASPTDAPAVTLAQAVVAPVDVPQKARDVLTEIEKRSGEPPRGYVGGRTFQNRERRLPRGSYREYDVNPKIRGRDRGPERIVIERWSGRAYYTPDHYETFIPMN